MNVGSIAYDTSQGLGYLAKDFFDHGIINKVAVRSNGRRVRHREWYKGGKVPIGDLLNRIDVLFLFEDALGYWDVVQQARDRNIPIVLMPMYECTRHPVPVEPNLWVCPSLTDKRFYKDIYDNVYHIPVPVPDNIEWKLRSKAETFVHNSGHGGLRRRNGTHKIIESLRYIQSNVRILIRAQDGNKATRELVELAARKPKPWPNNVELEIRIGECKWEHLYSEGDVFLFPDEFSGLSLPIQEAYASGMPVIAPHRYDFDQWLPKSFLIPVSNFTKERVFQSTIERANCDPKDIARTIDAVANTDIKSYSIDAKKWGKYNR
jgi:glycosyltransferase involved in cell wall biosynthesis